MKTKTPPFIQILKSILATICAAVFTATSVSAESFATLSGSGDSITLRKGETALVMAGAGTFTYAKPGKPCSFIRLSQNKKLTLRQTSHQAIPLAGPCKITVQSTDGFLGMRIVSSGVRPVTEKMRVASVPPKKSAVRP